MSDEARARGWAEWVDRWLTLFVVRDSLQAAETARLWEWAEIFDRAGRTPADLLAATDRVAVNLPRFREDYLQAVQDALRTMDRDRASKRSSAAAGARPDAGQGPSRPCLWCSGAGWVIVPRLDNARLGRDRTCAVTCRCPAGARLFDGLRGYDPPPWTLERYEQQNPDWWRQMSARADLERAAREAYSVDRALGELAARGRMGAT